MQSSYASGHDRRRATSLVVITWQRRESSHRVGHEQSRTDQSTANAEDQRWDHPGPPRLLRGPRKAVSRDAKERARNDEVRTLPPATSTGPEGTHRVTTRVVPSASRPDRGEATHEKRPGSDSACELRRNHPRLALTRGHSETVLGPWSPAARAPPVPPWAPRRVRIVAKAIARREPARRTKAITRTDGGRALDTG